MKASIPSFPQLLAWVGYLLVVAFPLHSTPSTSLNEFGLPPVPILQIRVNPMGIWVGSAEGFFRMDHPYSEAVQLSGKMMTHGSPSGMYWTDRQAIYQIDSGRTLEFHSGTKGIDFFSEDNERNTWAISEERAWLVEPDDSRPLPPFRKLAMGQGRWIGGVSERGVVILDLDDLSVDTLRGSQNWAVEQMLFDADRQLWVGTTNGLYLIGGFSSDSLHSKMQAEGHFKSLALGSSGIWAGTKSGKLFHFSYELETWSNQSGSNALTALFEDQQGNLWIGTQKGELKRLARKFEQRLRPFSADFPLAKGIALYHSNIWVSTVKGLWKWIDEQSSWSLETQVPAKNIEAIAQSDHFLWMSIEGEGIWKMNLQNGQSQSLFQTNRVRKWDRIQVIEKGRLLLGHGNDRWILDPSTQILSPLMEQSLPNSFLVGLTTSEDPSGDVWVWGKLGGLRIRAGKVIDQKNFFLEGLPEYALTEPNGTTWILTRPGNLYYLSGDTLRECSPESGLESGPVKGVGMLNQNLFVAQGQQLFRYNSELDFFFPLISDLPAPWRDSPLTTNALSMAGQTTLGPLSLELPFQPIHSKGQFVNVNGVVNGQPVTQEDLADFQMNFDTLIINWDWVEPFSQSKTRFQFLVEGLQTNWSTPSLKTSLSIGHLDPGEYSVRIRAIETDGFKEMPPFRILVRIPWYQDPLWLLVIGLLVAGAIFLGYSLRIRYLKKQRRTLQDRVQQATFEWEKTNQLLKKRSAELEEKSEALRIALSLEKGFNNAFAQASPDMVVVLDEQDCISQFLENQPPRVVDWLRERVGKPFGSLVQVEFIDTFSQALQSDQKTMDFIAIEFCWEDLFPEKWFEARILWMASHNRTMLVIRDITVLKKREFEQWEQSKKIREAVYEATKLEAQANAVLLHDEVGAQMLGLDTRIAMLKLRLENGESPGVKEVSTLYNEFRDVQLNIRNLSRGIADQADDRKLSRDLKTMIQTLKGGQESEIDIQFQLLGEESKLEPIQHNYIYSILLGLINNAFKHSGANSIKVQVLIGEREISMIVRDDGCGLKKHDWEGTGGKGRGSRLIKMRVKALGGQINYKSSPQDGTSFFIIIPLSDAPSSAPPSDR